MTAAKSVRGAQLAALRPQPDLTDMPDVSSVEALMVELALGGRLEKTGLMAREHLQTGGKRLRARLALAGVYALGAPRSHGVAWAAAVELLHNATLIHDDIQDGDRLRRGEPTLWAVHGSEQAINAGDLLLMLPYLALERLPPDVVGPLSLAIASHAVETVRGQANEMGLLGEPDGLSWHAYERAILGKTGALLALPVHGAALIAGRSKRTAAELGNVFAQLGLLFQLQDDVLDLYGQKGRDRVGSDLYEGKVSALVVAHLSQRPEDRDWLVKLLRTPREHTRTVDVLSAIDAFVDSGALAAILDRIDAIRDAVDADATLREAPGLHAVASQLAEVALAPIAHCRAIVSAPARRSFTSLRDQSRPQLGQEASEETQP